MVRWATAISVGAALLTVWAVAMLALVVRQFADPPSEAIEDASSWAAGYGAPTVGVAVAIGLPLGIVVGWVLRRKLVGRTDPG